MPTPKKRSTSVAASATTTTVGAAASATTTTAGLPLWLLACGIIVSSLCWALNQERLGSHNYGEGAGAERFTGVLVQGFAFSIFASLFSMFVLWTQGRAARPEGLHFTDVFAPALCHTIASPIGQFALQFIPYPLFILFSSCKLIPVMIVGTLVNKVSRPLQDFFSAGVMTQGVILYLLNKSGGEEHEEGAGATGGEQTLGRTLIGASLVLLNLFLEGYTNASQDRIFNAARDRQSGAKISGLRMMLDMNLWSAIFLGTVLLAELVFYALNGDAASSTLVHTWFFAQRHPELIMHLLQFSLFGSIALVFVFLTLEAHGGFRVTTITVTRKVVSMLLSVYLFSHPVNRTQWIGVLNVFAGLALQVWTSAGLDIVFVRAQPKAKSH